jgi:hypothetical protein
MQDLKRMQANDKLLEMQTGNFHLKIYLFENIQKVLTVPKIVIYLVLVSRRS